MRDYWLNKLFFDIQQPELAARYKKDRDAVLARYPMNAELRRAVLEPTTSRRWCRTSTPICCASITRSCGVKDAEFIQRLNELPTANKSKEQVSSHG